MRCAVALAAIVFGFATVAGAQPAPERVTVALSSYAFAPATLALKAGVPVTLHLVNNAGKSHDFSAPDFFASSSVAAADQSKIEDGAIDLDEGQSADVMLTPQKPGTYRLTCTHFLHAMFGMTGTIVVQ